MSLRKHTASRDVISRIVKDGITQSLLKTTSNLPRTAITVLESANVAKTNQYISPSQFVTENVFHKYPA